MKSLYDNFTQQEGERENLMPAKDDLIILERDRSQMETQRG